MKVLFIHNTAPDYRIPFFLKVSEKLKVKYIFTSIETNKKIYGNDIDFENLSKLEHKILKKGIKAYIDLYKELIKKDVQVVVIPPLDTLREYLLGMLAFLMCKLMNKKTIYFWEKWESPINYQTFTRKVKNNLLRLSSSIISKRVDICLSPGKKNKEYFISCGVKEEKIRKIHDSCEVPISKFFDLRNKYNIADNLKIILYYGRIIEQKGLDRLIKAYSELPNNLKNEMYLLIVGDGSFINECKKIARKLKIKNINFVGYVHPKERYNYFLQCDIFVHPGWFFEGRTDVWGLTLNEALQFGKVIISTNAVGASYDLIKENGIMVEQNNITELKDALIKASSDDFIKKAQISSIRIYDKYNYETMSKDFETVVNELL